VVKYCGTLYERNKLLFEVAGSSKMLGLRYWGPTYPVSRGLLVLQSAGRQIRKILLTTVQFFDLLPSRI